jgi:glyoxylase-like metal-dependent hydrolase (beta-lactamase superfamily II)
MLMATPAPFIEPLAHGVYVVDTGFVRPRFDASHLIVENGRAAFVDTGTNHAVPRLLQALEALGLTRDAVDCVIATHVHLDHAGGAGALLQHLPKAKLVVHPAGTRHLVDPSRLMASARSVYGDAEVARSYGELVAVAPGRVLETEDGQVLQLAGRALKFIHTPGHARHHHCVWDERSGGMFTGDTFGVAYPEFTSAGRPWLIPATPPTQFEPEALAASVRRILAFDPRRLYLTHYGEVTNVAALGATFLARLAQIVQLGATLRSHRQRPGALRHGLGELYRGWLREHPCALDEPQALALLGTDIELNAQGMDHWLAKLDSPAAHAPG